MVIKSEGVVFPNGATFYITSDRGVSGESGERYLLECLQTAPLPGWSIFVQPHLNGERPDFVLTHPKRGVIVIEVKDYDLSSGRYRRQDDKTQMLVNGPVGFIEIENPVEQAKRYAKNIKELYSNTFDSLFGENPKEMSVIETIIYFHNAQRQEALKFCGLPKHCLVADRSMASAMACGDMKEWGYDDSNLEGLWSIKYTLTGKPSNFCKPIIIKKMQPDWTVLEERVNALEAFVEDLNVWLMPTDGSLTQLRPVVVDNEMTEPTPDHKRLRGVAGAGKTIVLAERAARLLVKGKRVLILTYNLTLAHYIRDRVRAQLEAYPEHRRTVNVKENLTIMHFHGFLKWVASKHGFKLPSVRDSTEPSQILEEEWPKAVRDWRRQHDVMEPECLFDVLLIDEAQDFKEEWIHTALDWCSMPTQMFVVYDTAQDIYGRDSKVWLDTGTGLKFPVGGIRTLKHSLRLPPAVVRAASAFRRLYVPPDEKSLELTFPRESSKKIPYRCTLRWINAEWQGNANLITNINLAACAMHEDHHAHPNDVVFLARTEEMGIVVTRHFKVTRGFRVTHVFDLSGTGNHFIRRNEKWRFQPNAGSLKICTFHSFKGWESPYVQLIIDKDCTESEAALIYTALTRLKQLENGGQGALRVLNFSRTFDAMKYEFEKAELAQPPMSLFEA